MVKPVVWEMGSRKDVAVSGGDACALARFGEKVVFSRRLYI